MKVSGPKPLRTKLLIQPPSRALPTLTTALLVEVNFTVDIFESSDYLNDGYEEDCYFTDDQGLEALKVFKV